MRRVLGAIALFAVSGCAAEQAADGGGNAQPPPAPAGIPLLGNFTHDPSAVDLTVIATASDKLDDPRDLAFHPLRKNELWVVNRGDESFVMITNPGEPSQQAKRYKGQDSQHFLAQPSAIAFNQSDGTFATIHETDQKTQGVNGTPGLFMGPTLWSSDPAIFDGGVDGHIDMLHNSPDGMGIAWDKDNVYWVFDGYHGAVSRYDFRTPHEPGGTDHSDGIVKRYVEGLVKRQPDIPSDMVLDRATNKLYIADTGNNRLAVLDTTTGTLGSAMSPNYDNDKQYHVNGADLETFGDLKDQGNWWPSGLELHDGRLFVSDWYVSTIYAYSPKGELVDYLKLPEKDFPQGSLEGMAFDDQGRLYVVDAVGNRIVRIAARSTP